jgi:hypothetical protein
VHVGEPPGELGSGVALVRDQGERPRTARALKLLERDLTLVAFGRGERERSGRLGVSTALAVESII